MHNAASPDHDAIDVALTQPIAPDAALGVRVGPFAIAIFEVDGALHAIDGACMRCGASLAAGVRRGSHVACGGCGWAYELTSGDVVGLASLHLDAFRVERVGEALKLERKAR